MLAQPFLSPAFWTGLIYAGKIVGAVSVLGTALSYGGRAAWRVIKKISSINDNVSALTLEHWPKLQNGITEMRKEFDSVKQDVRGLDTRMAENRKILDQFSGAFLQHLEQHTHQTRALAAAALNGPELVSPKQSADELEAAALPAEPRRRKRAVAHVAI